MAWSRLTGAPCRMLAVLFLATLAIYFWGLGSIPLLSFNEARRSVPVQEMLASGDWLVPTLNHHLYISKPPLLYWLAGIPAWLFNSASEWIVRMPSALAALAITWLSFFSMRRRFGLTPAIFTVLILITSAGFTVFARRAEIEMLLAALCFGSLLAAFEYIFGRRDKRWLDLAYLSLGLALLTKGPVALLFYIPPLLVFWWRYRLPEALACLTHWRGWLIALAVALPWYLIISLKLGWDIWSHVVETDIAGKVGRSAADPLYQYPLWLIADFLPWCLLVLAMPRKSVRRWLATPQSGFLLIAAVVPVVIFSLIANKHAKYLLPTYPAWAALLALTVADFYHALREKGRQGLRLAAVMLVLGFFVYYAVGETRLLAHRHEALPKIAARLASYPGLPVYAWRDLDPRVVYYRGGPVAVLKDADLDAKLQARESLVLFVEDAAPAQVAEHMCRLAEFAPYLKSGHKATIYGSGTACP
ncbi:MAG TPA: glycosyltransferase family 39 protein [Novimethylophilus sp.]|jgi:4-amino-4-deoxy-L-arabinose transferase-like glycosyltransferase|uniref:ArnT family glycosyltransferase n=1 Tax=Novimethylophilus sp. TaxID=2137426 RepID=UPI002F40B33A